MPLVRAKRSGYRDTLHRLTLERFKRYCRWLSQFGAKGIVTEVGWTWDKSKSWYPTRQYATNWNLLAEEWYKVADTYQVPVCAWDVSEYQLFGGFWGSRYIPVDDASRIRAVSQRAQSADGTYTTAPIENHLPTVNYPRGVHMTAGDRAGAPYHNFSLGTFSTATSGSYTGTEYWYPGIAELAGVNTFEYLASRGLDLVRLPFKWERVQGTPGGALNTTELGRYETSVAAAAAAGLKVIADCHSYGEYHFSSNDTAGGTEVVKKFGNSPDGLGHEITQTHFVDLWQKLTARWKTRTDIWAYDLMNEPNGFPDTGTRNQALRWEALSQAAYNAVRTEEAVGANPNRNILVAGYNFNQVRSWLTCHPSTWITGTATSTNLYYNAHHYWDDTGNGQYDMEYPDAVTWASTQAI